MLLVECLARCPVEQLQRMALTAGVEPSARRHDLEQVLLVQLADPQRLSGLLADLTDDEWQALKVVYWGGAGQGVTVELCHQVVNLTTGRRRQGASQALITLMDRGLVYTRRADYRQVYFIPPELLPTLARSLEQRMAGRVAVTSDGGVIRPEPAPYDLVDEVHRFLAHIYKTELPLTQQGLIYRRHQRTLMELLGVEVPPEAVDPVPGRYPEPLGFITAFCLDQQLSERSTGVLRPGPHLVDWRGQSRRQMAAALFQYWTERYAYPDLHAFLHLAANMAAGWVRVEAAATELEPLLHPGQRAFLRPRLEHHLHRFLAPLGVFELARHDGQLLGRLTPAGRRFFTAAGAAPGAGPETESGTGPEAGSEGDAEGDTDAAYRFILQPSGEVVAPRPVPLPILWQLELVATLVQRGAALVYRIDRASVYDALRTGLSADDIRQFLERHSRTGLPQNLAFDLASWGQAYGQVSFQEACILRCADPVLAQQIRASRRTGRYVRGELGPALLVVDRADYDALYQALLEEGLLPRPGIERLGEGMADTANAPAGPGPDGPHSPR